jgi:hypothetical protein
MVSGVCLRLGGTYEFRTHCVRNVPVIFHSSL